MKLVLSFLIVCLAYGYGDHVSHNEKATSYQSIHMEHYHAVPTYLKKEDKHLVDHPISLGKTSAKVEVHHGDKHDPGYALTDVHSGLHHPEADLHDYGAAFALSHGEEHEGHTGDEGALPDHADYAHYQQLASEHESGFTANHGLGNYQTFHDSA